MELPNRDKFAAMPWTDTPASIIASAQPNPVLAMDRSDRISPIGIAEMVADLKAQHDPEAIEAEKQRAISYAAYKRRLADEANILVDSDGTTIDLRELKLTNAGLISGTSPVMDQKALKSFSVAVVRAATFNQRTLPLRQKAYIMYQIFGELFLNRSPLEKAGKVDPYIKVADSWYRAQLKPKSLRERLTIFKSRVADLFSCNPNVENLESFGMPGFQPVYRMNSKRP